MTKKKVKVSFWKKPVDKHFWFSIIKSGFRIVACYFLFLLQIPEAAIYFAVAECLGIVEEF